MQHPGPHFFNSGIDFGGSSINFVNCSLQEMVHIRQIPVVWGAKDEMSFEKLVNRGKRVWWLTRDCMFVNHNEVLVNHTPPGPHSQQIGLKALRDAVQMPLDTGPSLWQENLISPVLILTVNLDFVLVSLLNNIPFSFSHIVVTWNGMFYF